MSWVEFVGGPYDGEIKELSGNPSQIDFPVSRSICILENSQEIWDSPFAIVSYRKAIGHYLNNTGVRNAIRYEFIGEHK